MTFSDKTLTLLVLLSLGLSAFCLLVVAATTRVRSRLGQRAHAPQREMSASLREHSEAIARLGATVRKLAMEDRRLADGLTGAVQRVGLVRYDAFEDTGGRLSFSAALLNGAGDGMVVTSINGRSDTRCYAKPVSRGGSPHNLSEEEAEAIRLAMGEPAGRAAAS